MLDLVSINIIGGIIYDSFITLYNSFHNNFFGIII